MDTEATHDYGVEIDHSIPEVSYPGSSHKCEKSESYYASLTHVDSVSFDYWIKNTRWGILAEEGSRKNRYRYRLWLHEVESIDRLSRLMQQADRALRLLEATRTAVTGLAMSPYIRAVSEHQGVQITLSDATGRVDDASVDSGTNVGS